VGTRHTAKVFSTSSMKQKRKAQLAASCCAV
jgi:hypothetical protein